MARRTRRTAGGATAPTGGIRLSRSAPTTAEIEFLSEPPAIRHPKRIHPRHLLPLIREGAERNVHSTTREISFAPLALTLPVAAPGDEIKLRVNTELTQPGQNQTASNVNEPSCAIAGNIVLYT